jgi:hypothetical protein
MLTATTIASAADPNPVDKKEEPKKKKWESVATAGVTLTRGNSKSSLGATAKRSWRPARWGTKRTWTSDEALLGTSAGYGENSTTVGGNKVDTTTDSYFKAFGQWNHLITTQVFPRRSIRLLSVSLIVQDTYKSVPAAGKLKE